MPGIKALVAAISSDVVSRLAAGGFPPLTDGAILLGRQWLETQTAAPRIVFVLRRSRFGPRDTYGVDGPTWQAQRANPAIGSETLCFDVECWGVATPTPDPNGGDEDAAQALYQTLYQSLWTIAQGTFLYTDGDWIDQEEGAAQLQRYGTKLRFGLEIGTPIQNVQLQYVPTGTTGSITVEFDGSSTDGEVLITTTPM